MGKPIGFHDTFKILTERKNTLTDGSTTIQSRARLWGKDVHNIRAIVYSGKAIEYAGLQFRVYKRGNRSMVFLDSEALLPVGSVEKRPGFAFEAAVSYPVSTELWERTPDCLQTKTLVALDIHAALPGRGVQHVIEHAARDVAERFEAALAAHTSTTAPLHRKNTPNAE